MKEETKEEAQEEEKEEKPIDKMTVKELREIAHEIPGLTGISSMKKEELLDAVSKEKESQKEEGEEKEETEKGGEEEEAKEEEVRREKEAAAEEKPLDRMTAKELREIAREIPGVTGATAMKKEQLLEVIKKAKGIKEEASVKRRAKKAAADGVSIAELKQKIALLKRKKEEIRAARDRKKLDILRRRINRLKKRTRKSAQVA